MLEKALQSHAGALSIDKISKAPYFLLSDTSGIWHFAEQPSPWYNAASPRGPVDGPNGPAAEDPKKKTSSFFEHGSKRIDQ